MEEDSDSEFCSICSPIIDIISRDDDGFGFEREALSEEDLRTIVKFFKRWSETRDCACWNLMYWSLHKLIRECFAGTILPLLRRIEQQTLESNTTIDLSSAAAAEDGGRGGAGRQQKQQQTGTSSKKRKKSNHQNKHRRSIIIEEVNEAEEQGEFDVDINEDEEDENVVFVENYADFADNRVVIQRPLIFSPGQGGMISSSESPKTSTAAPSSALKVVEVVDDPQQPQITTFTTTTPENDGGQQEQEEQEPKIILMGLSSKTVEITIKGPRTTSPAMNDGETIDANGTTAADDGGETGEKKEEGSAAVGGGHEAQEDTADMGLPPSGNIYEHVPPSTDPAVQRDDRLLDMASSMFNETHHPLYALFPPELAPDQVMIDNEMLAIGSPFTRLLYFLSAETDVMNCCSRILNNATAGTLSLLRAHYLLNMLAALKHHVFTIPNGGPSFPGMHPALSKWVDSERQRNSTGPCMLRLLVEVDGLVRNRTGLCLALKHFKANTLANRIAGLNQISIYIMTFHEVLTTEHSENSKQNCKELANFLENEGVIVELFGPDSHPELLRQGLTVLEFIAHHNALSLRSLHEIWQAANRAECSRTVFDMLANVVKHFNATLLMKLYANLKEMSCHEHTEMTINLICIVMELIWHIAIHRSQLPSPEPPNDEPGEDDVNNNNGSDLMEVQDGDENNGQQERMLVTGGDNNPAGSLSTNTNHKGSSSESSSSSSSSSRNNEVNKDINERGTGDNQSQQPSSKKDNDETAVDSGTPGNEQQSTVNEMGDGTVDERQKEEDAGKSTEEELSMEAKRARLHSPITLQTDQPMPATAILDADQSQSNEKTTAAESDAVVPLPPSFPPSTTSSSTGGGGRLLAPMMTSHNPSHPHHPHQHQHHPSMHHHLPLPPPPIISTLHHPSSLMEAIVKDKKGLLPPRRPTLTQETESEVSSDRASSNASDRMIDLDEDDEGDDLEMEESSSGSTIDGLGGNVVAGDGTGGWTANCNQRRQFLNQASPAGGAAIPIPLQIPQQQQQILYHHQHPQHPHHAPYPARGNHNQQGPAAAIPPEIINAVNLVPAYYQLETEVPLIPLNRVSTDGALLWDLLLSEDPNNWLGEHEMRHCLNQLFTLIVRTTSNQIKLQFIQSAIDNIANNRSSSNSIIMLNRLLQYFSNQLITTTSNNAVGQQSRQMTSPVGSVGSRGGRPIFAAGAAGQQQQSPHQPIPPHQLAPASPFGVNHSQLGRLMNTVPSVLLTNLNHYANSYRRDPQSVKRRYTHEAELLNRFNFLEYLFCVFPDRGLSDVEMELLWDGLWWDKADYDGSSGGPAGGGGGRQMLSKWIIQHLKSSNTTTVMAAAAAAAAAASSNAGRSSASNGQPQQKLVASPAPANRHAPGNTTVLAMPPAKSPKLISAVVGETSNGNVKKSTTSDGGPVSSTATVSTTSPPVATEKVVDESLALTIPPKPPILLPQNPLIKPIKKILAKKLGDLRGESGCIGPVELDLLMIIVDFGRQIPNNNNKSSELSAGGHQAVNEEYISPQLCLPLLWDVGLKNPNTNISLPAINFLSSYYASFNDPGEAAGKESEFVQLCCSYLESSYNVLKADERCAKEEMDGGRGTPNKNRLSPEERDANMTIIHRALVIAQKHIDTFRKQHSYLIKEWEMNKDNNAGVGADNNGNEDIMTSALNQSRQQQQQLSETVSIPSPLNYGPHSRLHAGADSLSTVVNLRLNLSFNRDRSTIIVSNAMTLTEFRSEVARWLIKLRHQNQQQQQGHQQNGGKKETMNGGNDQSGDVYVPPDALRLCANGKELLRTWNDRTLLDLGLKNDTHILINGVKYEPRSAATGWSCGTGGVGVGLSQSSVPGSIDTFSSPVATKTATTAAGKLVPSSPSSSTNPIPQSRTTFQPNESPMLLLLQPTRWNLLMDIIGQFLRLANQQRELFEASKMPGGKDENGVMINNIDADQQQQQQQSEEHKHQQQYNLTATWSKARQFAKKAWFTVQSLPTSPYHYRLMSDILNDNSGSQEIQWRQVLIESTQFAAHKLAYNLQILYGILIVQRPELKQSFITNGRGIQVLEDIVNSDQLYPKPHSDWNDWELESLGMCLCLLSELCTGVEERERARQLREQIHHPAPSPTSHPAPHHRSASSHHQQQQQQQQHRNNAPSPAGSQQQLFNGGDGHQQSLVPGPKNTNNNNNNPSPAPSSSTVTTTPSSSTSAHPLQPSSPACSSASGGQPSPLLGGGGRVGKTPMMPTCFNYSPAANIATLGGVEASQRLIRSIQRLIACICTGSSMLEGEGDSAGDPNNGKQTVPDMNLLLINSMSSNWIYMQAKTLKSSFLLLTNILYAETQLQTFFLSKSNLTDWLRGILLECCCSPATKNVPQQLSLAENVAGNLHNLCMGRRVDSKNSSGAGVGSTRSQQNISFLHPCRNLICPLVVGLLDNLDYAQSIRFNDQQQNSSGEHGQHLNRSKEDLSSLNSVGGGGFRQTGIIGRELNPYFWLLTQLIPLCSNEELIEQSDSRMSLESIASNILLYLKNRPFYEIRDGHMMDAGLTGLLKLEAAILPLIPAWKSKDNEGDGGGGGRQLLTTCISLVFDLPERHRKHLPKCKSLESRVAAFDLLIALVTGCSLNYNHLFDFILKQNEGNNYNWEYWPREEKRSDCGYVGIENLGATCYMASAVQHLYMMPSFRDAILRARVGDTSKHVSEFTELQRLFAYLHESHRRAYNPLDFCKAYHMDNAPLNTSEQKDMTEFFNDLITKLQEMQPSLKKVVKRLFAGKMSNSVVSDDCAHRSMTSEDFFSVRVQVADMRDLCGSLEKLTMADVLEGDNMYTCSQCNRKVRAKKRSSFKELPEILSFNTLRYTFNMITMMKEKVNTLFSFPIKLEMRPYLEETLLNERRRSSSSMHQQQTTLSSDPMNQDNNDQQQPSPTEYELIGVTVHTGTAEGGHYYAYIRDPNNPHQWFNFNDGDVRVWDPINLASECFGGESSRPHFDNVQDRFMDLSFEKANSAYMLFYQRVHSVSTTGAEPTGDRTFADNGNGCGSDQATTSSADEEISLQTDNEDGVDSGKCRSRLIQKPSAEAAGGDQQQITMETDEGVVIAQQNRQQVIRLPEELERWIWNDNVQFQYHLMLFNHRYIDFVWQLAHATSLKLTDVSTQQLIFKSVQLSLRLVFETLIHAKEKPSIMDWAEHLHKLLSASVKGCEWFLEVMMDEKMRWVINILIGCNLSSPRQLLEKIINHVIITLNPHHSPLYLTSTSPKEGAKAQYGLQSVVTKFIRRLIRQLNMSSCMSVPVRQLNELLNVLRTFSVQGGLPARQFLLSIGAIRTLIDFYLRRTREEQQQQQQFDANDDDSDEELGLLSLVRSACQSRTMWMSPALETMIPLITELVAASREIEGWPLCREDRQALIGVYPHSSSGSSSAASAAWSASSSAGSPSSSSNKSSNNQHHSPSPGPSGSQQSPGSGGQQFTFLIQQIKDCQNLNATCHLIITLTDLFPQLPVCFIDEIFNQLKLATREDQFQPYMTLLAQLCAHENGSEKFVNLVLNKIWAYGLDYKPVQCLKWLMECAEASENIRAFMLREEILEKVIENYLLKSPQYQVRQAAGECILSLIGPQVKNTYIRYQQSPLSHPVHFSTVPRSMETLHLILEKLLTLMPRAEHFASYNQYGSHRLIFYFTAIRACLVSPDEKRMVAKHVDQFWSIYHHKLQLNEEAIYMNKQALFLLWWNASKDCRQVIDAAVKNAEICENYMLNYIVVDNDKEKVQYNKSFLTAFYGLGRLLCAASAQFSQYVMEHDNLNFAVVSVAVRSEYRLIAEDILGMIEACLKHSTIAPGRIKDFKKRLWHMARTIVEASKTNFSMFLRILRFLVEGPDDKLYLLENGVLNGLSDVLASVHRMYHEATACNMLADLTEVLKRFLDFLRRTEQCISSDQSKSAQKAGEKILNGWKNWQTTADRLLTLLNSFIPYEIRKQALAALEAMVKLKGSESEFTKFVLMIILKSHRSQLNCIGTCTTGPYFPKRVGGNNNNNNNNSVGGVIDEYDQQQNHQQRIIVPPPPSRPMLDMHLHSVLLETTKGVDPKYDDELAEYFGGYHALIDRIIRERINQTTETADPAGGASLIVEISCLSGLQAVPLHFAYFPKLWLDIHEKNREGKKPTGVNLDTFLDTLYANVYFHEYLSTILVEEQSSLANPWIYQFFTLFLPKILGDILPSNTNSSAGNNNNAMSTSCSSSSAGNKAAASAAPGTSSEAGNGSSSLAAAAVSSRTAMSSRQTEGALENAIGTLESVVSIEGRRNRSRLIGAIRMLTLCASAFPVEKLRGGESDESSGGDGSVLDMVKHLKTGCEQLPENDQVGELVEECQKCIEALERELLLSNEVDVQALP